MKKNLLLFLALLLGGSVFGQVKFGLKVGGSTSSIQPKDLLVTNSTQLDSLALGVKNAKGGLHFGGFVRFGKKLYLQPELDFNSNKVDYQATGNSGQFNGVFQESYQNLDIPLLFGYDTGVVRLHAGPVGHVHLNSSSELTDLSGYAQKFKEFTYGWQGGIGFDIWKLNIDLKYEGNFSKFGDHITFFDQEFKFSDSESRILFSLAYVFGK
jgi:hypothetical protein